MRAAPQQRYRKGYASPFTLRPHPRNAGSSLPLHLAGGWGTGQCAWQVHHTALGTQGRAPGWAQPSLRSPPPFWSLVFLFVPRGPSTWQRKRLWEGEASPALGACSLNLMGSAEILESRLRLTPSPVLLVGAGQSSRTVEGAS